MVDALRQFLRDYAELNRLIAGEESDDRSLAFAILDGLDDFNTSPPVTTYTLNNFPSRHILLRLGAISVLESVGLLQTRNQLSFNDGSGVMSLSDKTPLIMSWLQMFKNTTEEKKRNLKVALNIEDALAASTGLETEYGIVSQLYGNW